MPGNKSRSFVLTSGPITTFFVVSGLATMAVGLLVVPVVQQARKAARRDQASRMGSGLKNINNAFAYYHHELGTISWEQFYELPADALRPENDYW